jgi:two-component system, chemotaxis family, chemotaxis protein CheY
MEQTPHRIVLLGHCGPDSSYLRIAISSALPGSTILFPHDEEEFQLALRAGADLVLFNRELDGFFTYHTGVEYIRAMKKSHPQIKTMLISNYADAQSAAVAAGALPGFGKRQLGSKEVVALLRQAVENRQPSPT